MKLFLLAFFTIAFAFDSSHLQENRVNAKHLLSSFSAPKIPMQLQASAECNVALADAFVFLTNNSCFAIFDLISNKSVTNQQLTTSLDSFCGPCQVTGQAKLKDAATLCKGYINDTDLETIQKIWFTSSVLCGRNDADTAYCFPSFRTFIMQLEAGTPLNNEFLATNCNNCTRDVAAAWLALDRSIEAVINVTGLALICEYRANTWCYVHFQQNVALAEITRDLDATCHPCTFALLRRFSFIVDAKIVQANLKNYSVDALEAQALDLAKMRIYLRAICVKNWQGNYCIREFPKYPESNFTANCATSFGQCQPECKTFLGDAVKDLGCCTGTLVNFMTANCDVRALSGAPCSAAEGPALLLALATSCDVHIPAGCGVQQAYVTATLRFDNLDYAWCIANPLICSQLMKNVVGYLTGLDNDDLANFTTSSATGARRLLSGGVETRMNVASDSPAVKTAQENLAQAIFPDTLFVPNAARAELTSPVALAVVSYNSSLNTDPNDPTAPSGSAQHVFPSVITLLAVVALAFA